MTGDCYRGLSDTQLQLLDAVCLDFEQACARGPIPELGQFLEEVSDDVLPDTFRELLAIELECRQSRGEVLRSEGYLARYPEWAELVAEVFRQLPAAPSKPGDTLHGSLDDTGVMPVPPELRSANHQSASGRDQTTGELIAGRYRLLGLLGRGGMGAVYRARDELLDREIAIKFPEFNGNAVNRAIAVERFQREARVMAALDHPHVCRIFDSGEDQGRQYLTMGLIEGQPLSQQPLPMSVEHAVSVVQDVARAIADAHALGVIHRDLKPSNIMLTERNEPVVLDFGLASVASSADSQITHSGTLIGSPAFMAPEQLRAQHQLVGPQSDVYSLGVILFQLLTGRPPYQGTAFEVIAQVIARPQIEWPAGSHRVPAQLKEVCLRAMAHDPADRYRTAVEFVEALDESLAGRRPVPLRGRRSISTPGLIAAGIVLVVAATFFINRYEDDASSASLTPSVAATTADVGSIIPGGRGGRQKKSSASSLGVPVPPASPEGAIYFADRFLKRIRRVNLDGSGLTDMVTEGLQDPLGVTVDVVNRKLYWSDIEKRTIERSDLDSMNGRIEQLVTTELMLPRDIELDVAAGKMYWVDSGDLTLFDGREGIRRANLDGTEVETLVPAESFAEFERGPHGLALDLQNRHIYWTAMGVWRCNLDGSNVTLLRGEMNPNDIELDPVEQVLYFTDHLDQSIKRMNLDGGELRKVVSHSHQLITLGIGLDLARNRIFLTDASRDDIRNCDLLTGGQTVIQNFITGDSKLGYMELVRED